MSSHVAPVSVVIPVHNGGEFIRGALASVAAQTLLPAEIIVVDDGSSDASASMAASLGAKVLSQANAGVSAARNRGVEAAAQPWIAFLDVDDLWSNEKLALQWTALQKSHAGWSFCDYSPFGGDAIIATSFRRYSSHGAAFEKVRPEPLDRTAVVCRGEKLGLALCESQFIAPSSVMVKRELLSAVGGFDSSLPMCEDYELWLRLAAVSDAVLVTSPVVFYNVRPGSLSSNLYEILAWENVVEERIQARPDRYPAGVAERFRKKRVPNLNRAALDLVRRRRFIASRASALQGIREQVTTRGIVLLALSYLLAATPISWLWDQLWRLRRSLRRQSPEGGTAVQQLQAELAALNRNHSVSYLALAPAD